MTKDAKVAKAPARDPGLVKLFRMAANSQGKTYEQNVAELIAALDAAIPGMEKAMAQKKARQARAAQARAKKAQAAQVLSVVES